MIWIIMLTPSLSGHLGMQTTLLSFVQVLILSIVLIISTDFAKQYNIIFNPEKTVIIKFGSPAYLIDSAIQWADQVGHLGNIVHSNISDLSDRKIKCSTLIGSVTNKLFGTYKDSNQDTMYHLFQSYRCSFDGSQLWDFNYVGFKLYFLLKCNKSLSYT